MTIFYSPTEKGFFDSAMHAKARIPADAIEVTAAARIKLLEGLAEGRAIDVAGHEPVLVDVFIDPAYLAAHERAWRDSTIEQLAWLRQRHTDEQAMNVEPTLTESQFLELLNYTQQLRDWPQSADFPSVEHRPLAPAWLSGSSG